MSELRLKATSKARLKKWESVWLFCMVHLCFLFPAVSNTVVCTDGHFKSTVIMSMCIYVCVNMYRWGNKKEEMTEKTTKSSLLSRKWLDTRLFVHYHHVMAMKKASEFSVIEFHQFNIAQQEQNLNVFTYTYIYLSSMFHIVFYLS